MTKNFIGKFSVVKKLGEGFFGEVFLVMDPSTKINYAIKAISFTNSKSVMNEIGMMLDGRVRSEFLVRYYSSFSDESYMYIVMEYMEAGNLLNWMKKQKLPLTEKSVLKILAEIVEGVKVLHDNLLIHSDIKLQNILVNKRNEIKLGDFGSISKEVGTQRNMSSSTGIGTMGFMPVEVLNGKKPSPAADMFAVGCVTYKLMTQHGPFDAATPLLVVKNVMDNKYAPITGNWSNELKSLVYQLLSPDYSKRPTVVQVKALPFIRAVFITLAPRGAIAPAPSTDGEDESRRRGGGGGGGGAAPHGTDEIDPEVAEFITGAATNAPGNPPLTLAEFRALFLDVMGVKASLRETNLFIRLQRELCAPPQTKVAPSPTPPKKKQKRKLLHFNSVDEEATIDLTDEGKFEDVKISRVYDLLRDQFGRQIKLIFGGKTIKNLDEYDSNVNNRTLGEYDIHENDRLRVEQYYYCS